MNGMTKSELIEVVAAVSFRVLGLTYAIGVLQGIVSGLASSYLNTFYLGNHSQLPNDYYFTTCATIVLNTVPDMVLAIVFYRFAVSLARLVTRGLLTALELKPAV
jgi:hypothetical protein